MQAAAPTLRAGAQVVAGNTNWAHAGVSAPRHEYLEIRDWPLRRRAHASSRPRSPARRQGRAASARRWPSSCSATPIPIDQVIRVKSVPVTVIGVLERRARTRSARTRTTWSSCRSPPIATASRAARGRLKRVQSISVKVRDGAQHEGGGGGHPRAAAPAPPDAARRRRRLLHAQPDRDAAGAGRVEPRHDAAARRGGAASAWSSAASAS